MEYNGKECKKECNCIDVAEFKNNGEEVKNYRCLKPQPDFNKPNPKLQQK